MYIIMTHLPWPAGHNVIFYLKLAWDPERATYAIWSCHNYATKTAIAKVQPYDHDCRGVPPARRPRALALALGQLPTSLITARRSLIITSTDTAQL